MDERVMRMWVHEVLKPYVEDAPVHIQSLYLLDSYQCHTMASVTVDIEALGVQVKIIPGGCTGLCQPVDVRKGKPLTSKARHLWEEWMIDQCTTNNGRRLRPPSRLLMSQWINDSVNHLRESDSLIRKSWRHAEYSYFPNEAVAAVAIDEAADAPDNDAAVERGDEGPLLAAPVGEDISDDSSSRSDDANVALPPPDHFHQRCLHTFLKNFHISLLVLTLVGTILTIPTIDQDLHPNLTVINRLCFSLSNDCNYGTTHSTV